MKTNMKADLVTVTEAADVAHVSRATVANWIGKGTLRAVRMEGRGSRPIVRIYREDLRRFMQGRETVSK